MNEIRFHGMGGQGAVMGALMLAEAAFAEGKYAQKIPVYGGMRRGGDVTVFLRLDDKPIRRTSGIYEPDALMDEFKRDYAGVVYSARDGDVF